MTNQPIGELRPTPRFLSTDCWRETILRSNHANLLYRVSLLFFYTEEIKLSVIDPQEANSAVTSAQTETIKKSVNSKKTTQQLKSKLQ